MNLRSGLDRGRVMMTLWFYVLKCSLDAFLHTKLCKDELCFKFIYSFYIGDGLIRLI